MPIFKVLNYKRNDLGTWLYCFESIPILLDFLEISSKVEYLSVIINIIPITIIHQFLLLLTKTYIFPAKIAFSLLFVVMKVLVKKNQHEKNKQLKFAVFSLEFCQLFIFTLLLAEFIVSSNQLYIAKLAHKDTLLSFLMNFYDQITFIPIIYYHSNYLATKTNSSSNILHSI